MTASTLHAVVCLTEGCALADQRLADALWPPTRLLLDELAAAGLPQARAMQMLYALAASGVDNRHQLAQQALVKLLGAGKLNEAVVGRLAGRLSDLQVAMLRFDRPTVEPTDDRSPALVDEIVLRGRPLAGQWEARGPGMLRVLARMTEQDLLVEHADVVLVWPALGGGGTAHLPVGAVSFEAVLVNPHDDLPEVARLAWLLAQLNMDLPKYAEHVPADRLGALAAQATIPAVLAAAQIVELARLDEPTITRALGAWRVAPAEAAPALAETLLTWWTTYDQRPTPWAVALAALDEMVAPGAMDRA